MLIKCLGFTIEVLNYLGELEIICYAIVELINFALESYRTNEPLFTH